jgi:hypothetical protein
MSNPGLALTMTRQWKLLLVASLLVSVIMLYAGTVVLLGLPSYNPYSFRETFNGPLDANFWETVGTGTSTIADDGLTLQSKTSEAYALRRYLWTQPRWNGPWEVRVLGDVGLRFRLNDYSKDASAYVILETDTLRLGLLGSKIVVQEVRTGRSSNVTDFVAGNWYRVELGYNGSAVMIDVDGAAVWNSTRSQAAGFGYRAWIAVGNLQPKAFGRSAGGSVTVADLTCLCRPLPWLEDGT